MRDVPNQEFQNIQSVTTHLRFGGLLIYPTETFYAIGCDATNPRAVAAIFRLKGRERKKSLPLIVASQAMAKRYAVWTPLADRLARKYWPGPLTIVADSRKPRRFGRDPDTRSSGPTAASRFVPIFSPPHIGRGSDASRSDLSRSEHREHREHRERGWGILAPDVIASDGTIALRISSDPTARSLARRLGRPIVSTSANRSGEPPARTYEQALAAFHGKGHGKGVRPFTRQGPTPLLALDGGTLRVRKPSTIVDVRGTTPIILRSGSIPITIKIQRPR